MQIEEPDRLLQETPVLRHFEVLAVSVEHTDLFVVVFCGNGVEALLIEVLLIMNHLELP